MEFQQPELDSVKDPELLKILRGILAAQKHVVERLDGFGRRLDAQEASFVERFMNAFPGGDVDGHRRYHELKIEELEERRKLRKAIEEKTISGLIWSGVVAIGSFLFIGIKAWILNTFSK